MPVIQVVIDESISQTIIGTHIYDRDTGGTLVIPSGSSLPGIPAAKELFWNTTDGILYRRNDTNTAWESVEATAAAHDLGGSSHNADTLANLNSKVSDATLDDSSDPRDPNAHNTSHQSGGGDSIKLDDLSTPDDNTDLNATVSAHGLLPKLGGGTINFLRADGTWAEPTGGLVAHDLGGTYHNADTLANLNSKISDATLDDSSDPRDPNAHNTSHQSGGGDSIKLDDLSTPDDNTDLNATTSYHGLLPKLGGGTVNFLRADGTWAEPAGGLVAHDLGGTYHNADTLANLNSKISDATLDDSSSSRTPTAHNTSHQSGGSDAIKLDDLSTPDDNTDLDATTSYHGLLPKLGGGTSNFLRADGTWAAPSTGTGRWPPSSTDPSSGMSDGDRYYNTVLKMDMQYDSSRSKWMSVTSCSFTGGDAGNTSSGTYYTGIDGTSFSDTSGYVMPYNGTLIAIGYTRADTDSATFEVTASGTAIAELASSAGSGYTSSLNANFSAGNILGIRNKSGSNTVSAAQIYFIIKWRL